MMLLFLTVFGVSCGFAIGLLRDKVCNGHSYKLPSKYFPTQSNDRVYFTPSHGGPKKLIIDKGMPVNPRIRIDSNSFWLVGLTNKDEGTFGLSSDGNRLKNVLMLQILDCAETITMFYAESLERNIPADTLLLDYVPQDSVDEPITLWNHTALAVTSNTGSTNTIIMYVTVSCSILAFAIFCCCCCCRKRCEKDTPNTEATVYDHDLPPTVPTYSGPVYPSAYPQQPGYQPVNIYPPPVTNVNPSQPGYMNANPVPPAISVSPPPPGYMNTNPIPAGIVSPPSPGVMNVNPPPPGITTNLLQTEVAPPADQGPTSTPTFSSEFLSSDSEPRFELTGFNIPFASPLMSNTSSSDVYNSDKLNFQ